MFKDLETKRAYDRQYYARMSKEKKKRKYELQQVRVNTIRKLVYNHKLKHGCIICGESEPACLDYHHTKDDKEVNVADAVKWGWSLDRIQQEIEKCVVVCANCHRLIHANIINIVT